MVCFSLNRILAFIPRAARPHIVAMAGLLNFSAALAAPGDFIPQYGNVTNPQYQILANRLRQSNLLEKLSVTLSQLVNLPQKVTVSLSECRQRNAFYSKQASAIIICVELVAAIFEQAPRKLWNWGTRCPYPPIPACDRPPSPDESARAASGAVLFVLMHELGHALVDLLHIPVLGREEDAADQISIYLLINSGFGQDGLSGVNLFFEITQPLFYMQKHFADTHSVDSTRRFNLFCWAYGSDPQKYSYLVDHNALPRQRADRCPNEYRQMSSAVRQLLGDRVNRESSRR